MDNITMPISKDGWLSGGEASLLEPLIEEYSCTEDIKTLTDACDDLVKESSALYEKFRNKDLNDAMVHLESAYKSLNQII